MAENNYDLEYTGSMVDRILDTGYDLQNQGYIFRGLASHYTGTPTERTWLIAPTGSTGFGLSSPVPPGSIGICMYNGSSWSAEVLNTLTLDSAPTTGSGNGITSGAVKTLAESITNAIGQLEQSVSDRFTSMELEDTTGSLQAEVLSITLKYVFEGEEETLTSLSILAATAEKAGLMSAADKQKLDAFVTNIRSLRIQDTTAQADQGTEITNTLKWTIGGVTEAITAFTLYAATTSKAGLMSAADKTALDTLPSLINAGYLYAGIATPSTVPSSTSAKIYYIAIDGGTYTNFGNLNVTQGINIIYKSGDAWSVAQVVGIDNEPTAGSDNLVKSGGVKTELALGAVYDVSAHHNGATFESLSALLSDTDLNALIPTAVRKGGMSIKFVQSSDNKYVQFRLMDDEWSTNTDDWSFCGDDVLEENPEFIEAKTDNDGRLLEARRKDGTKVEYCDLEVKGSFINDGVNNLQEVSSYFLPIDNKEWLQVITDDEGRVIEGITKDGKKFINVPLSNPTIEEIRKEANGSKWKGKTAVTLGDSHSQRRDEWMPKLCEMLGMEFLESLNSQIPVGNVTPPAYEMYINAMTAQVAALISLKSVAIPDVIFIENVHYFYNDRPSAFPFKPSSMELVGEYNMTKAEEIAYFAEHFSEIVSSVTDKESRKVIKTVINGKTCTVTFSASSISSGTFEITLDGVTISTELTAGMTLAQAVGKIMEWQFGDYTDWVNVSKTDNSISFRYNGEGQAVFNFAYNAGGTGLSASAGNITDIGESIYRYYASNTMDDWNTASKWIRVVDWYQGYMQNKGVMELLQENFPQSIIVVLGIANWRLSQSDYDDLDYYEFTHTDSFLLSESRKEGFLECGKMYDCKTVDVEKLCGISPINYLTFYNPNEVHPKPIGYERWAETIAKELD